MLQYKRIVSNLLDQNIYILYNNQNEAIIVDPGLGFDLIDSFIKSKNLNPIAIIGTHAHIDHIASADECIEHYNIPFHLCEQNKLYLDNYDKLAGFWKVKTKKPNVSNWINKSSKKLSIGSFHFKLMYNPGHSVGCMSFAIESLIFCGDLIFKGSIGRTDLPTSNPSDMEQSLKMFVNSFDVHSTLLTGHREETSLENELKTNPFLVNYAK
tara:strand:- start:1648 stop:2280 length:633 start_codon:yes stop_codon:yes gene_type:complete